MTKNISDFFDHERKSLEHIKNIKNYNSKKRSYNNMKNNNLSTLPPFSPILVKYPYDQNEYHKSYRKIFLLYVINDDTLDKIKLYNEYMIELNN
jgi:hypothetical protein